MKNTALAAITVVTVLTGTLPSHAEEPPLSRPPILDSALARVNAAVVVQAGSSAPRDRVEADHGSGENHHRQHLRRQRDRLARRRRLRGNRRRASAATPRAQ